MFFLCTQECLERNDPGPAALRRVSMAGSRNRARILMMAGEAIGIPMMDTVPDQSSRGKYRCAVTHLDITVNSIRRIEENVTRPTYQYTTCVDAGISQGLMSMSNISDGVVLMLSCNGEVRQTLRNDAYCTLPYSTKRLTTDRELISVVTKEHKEALKHKDAAHPDHEFVRDRFSWSNRKFDGLENVTDLEPLALWGNYDREVIIISKRNSAFGCKKPQFCALVSGFHGQVCARARGCGVPGRAAATGSRLSGWGATRKTEGCAAQPRWCRYKLKYKKTCCF